MGDLVQPDLQLGPIVKLTKFAVDDSAHNSDGLLLHGWDGDQLVTGFISRRVMDDWVDPRQPYRGAAKPLSRTVQRARQAQPRGDRANRRHQISARPGVQLPVPVCRYSGVGHHQKRRDARYERTGARTAASLFPTDATLGSLSERQPGESYVLSAVAMKAMYWGSMPRYRIYTIGRDDHFWSDENIRCADDQDATQRAHCSASSLRNVSREPVQVGAPT
jgi:hypothetical protein